MRSVRGFTLIELLVVLGLIGIISAIAIPVLSSSTERNAVWTASEQIGSQLRQARLKAITRNQPFRVVFDCPAANQYRVLIVDDTIDDEDRCDNTLEHDSGVYTIPPLVAFDNDGAAVPALQVSGRGVYSLPGGVGVLPLTITVQYSNTHSRWLTVSTTGQITFEDF